MKAVFRNVSKPVKGRPTSNTAEIQACLTALRIVKKHEVERVKIVTDSQFVVNAMTKWIETWKSSKWKNSTGKEVKNKSDFIKLHNAAKKLQDVRWVGTVIEITMWPFHICYL